MLISNIVSGDNPKGIRKSDFITTMNYYIWLRVGLAELLIDETKNNFNNQYEFKHYRGGVDNIMFDDIIELNRYILRKEKNT